MVLQQNKVILVKDEIYRRNSDSSLGIYLSTAKVVKCRMFDENRIDQEEAKKEAKNKIFMI